jgi:FdhD protein
MALAHTIETRRVITIRDGVTSLTMDSLLQEQPLVIDVAWPGGETHYTTTMRTPGDDFALAVGLLATETQVTREIIHQTRYCVGAGNTQDYNKVTVSLKQSIDLQPPSLRPVSCGWCGVADLVDRLIPTTTTAIDAMVSTEELFSLANEFGERQRQFASTGASHAALLKTHDGSRIIGEDVGRHNALDKAIGHAVLDQIDITNGIALLSGRAGSDLVLKAARVGLSYVCSVSAPTALAVELANEAGITLIGFLRPGRMNIYSHPEGITETYDATRALR